MYRDDEYCQLRARIQELENENKELRHLLEAAKTAGICAVKKLAEELHVWAGAIQNTGPK